jgi:hypothetical protein
MIRQKDCLPHEQRQTLKIKRGFRQFGPFVAKAGVLERADAPFGGEVIVVNFADFVFDLLLQDRRRSQEADDVFVNDRCLLAAGRVPFDSPKHAR